MDIYPSGIKLLPEIDSANPEPVHTCFSRAEELYGSNFPEAVEARLVAELNSIWGNNYSVIYLIAHKLIEKSKESGYLVSTRGSIGASFVAYLLGITDFNPLEYNLPFEVFAGLDGKKRPDVVLNIAEGYRETAINYLVELFSEDKVLEVSGHPGKIIILPRDAELPDFMTIQQPERIAGGSIPTVDFVHFDYRSYTNIIFSFDLIVHSNLTTIKKLEDATGVDARVIPLDDEKTLELFASADTLGVPEFEADNVLDIIATAKPKTFHDLVKVFGLAHGTGVWLGNAEGLIYHSVASISEVIATRDEIMTDLMDKGLCRDAAYEIMENVRTGNGLDTEHERIMGKTDLPDWYIDSCKKIAYLFPKSHAVAYTSMAFRIAWFKAHYPKEFWQVHGDV